MQPVVPFVGLTGGMGAGKSTALKALDGLGAQVLSTDAVVHELYGDAQSGTRLSSAGETRSRPAESSTAPR